MGNDFWIAEFGKVGKEEGGHIAEISQHYLTNYTYRYKQPLSIYTGCKAKWENTLSQLKKKIIGRHQVCMRESPVAGTPRQAQPPGPFA